MRKRISAVILVFAILLSGSLILPVFAANYEEIVPPDKYRYVGNRYGRSFSEGLAAVTLGEFDERGELNKWGFIDQAGNEVIPRIYELHYAAGQNDGYRIEFSEGLAAVPMDGKFGYIDKNGDTAIPFIYDWVWSFSEGLAKVIKDGECCFIGKTGNEVISGVYDNWDGSTGYFSEGLVWVIKDGKLGYMDKNGNVAVPFAYEHWGTISPNGGDFSEGLAPVKKGEWPNEKYGYIDKDGNEVIPIIYDAVYGYGGASNFSEGLALVGKGEYPNAKLGYIDKDGNEVIPFIYDEGTRDFSEGLAAVRIGDWSTGKSGYIDKNGNEALPFIYDSAGDFSEGLAAVVLDGKWGIIDKAGNEIVPFGVYDYIGDVSEGIAAVGLNGKYGFIRITTQADDIIRVTVNGEYLSFDQPPVIIDDRTLVPLRAIFEALGAAVEWDGDTQTVTATKYSTVIELQIGSNILIKNGESIILDVPAQLINNRTLVPVRAVAESFGAKVEWDEERQTVNITE